MSTPHPASAPPSALSRAWHSLGFKFRVASTLFRLKLRHHLGRGPVVADYGWGKLPFTNDGDLQESMYHAHAQNWRAKESAELSRYITRGASVVDVGANMGFMALIFSDLVGPEGRVFAFEPSAKTFAKLKQVIELNHCRNITPFQKGCGDKAAQLTLYHTGLSSGNASVLGTTADHKRSSGETIEIVRLDDFLLPQAAKIDFVKIDTEGFEPAVLRGATGLMKRDKPKFRIEMNSEFKDSCMESMAILKSQGYRFLEEPNFDAGPIIEDFVAVAD